MNDSMEDELRKKRDMLYYNQLVREERKKSAKKQQHKKKKKQKVSFGAQKVDFRDFIYVPEEWAPIAYTIYVVGIPYLAGAIFLFLVIARGSYENFKLLDINAFPIVWLIGYEIVAIVMLVWILILYLKYDDEDDY